MSACHVDNHHVNWLVDWRALSTHSSSAASHSSSATSTSAMSTCSLSAVSTCRSSTTYSHKSQLLRHIKWNIEHPPATNVSPQWTTISTLLQLAMTPTLDATSTPTVTSASTPSRCLRCFMHNVNINTARALFIPANSCIVGCRPFLLLCSPVYSKNKCICNLEDQSQLVLNWSCNR